MCCAFFAGSLYPAGGGDGRHGAGDQHEWDRSTSRGAEPHGKVRGQDLSVMMKGLFLYKPVFTYTPHKSDWASAIILANFNEQNVLIC